MRGFGVDFTEMIIHGPLNSSEVSLQYQEFAIRIDCANKKEICSSPIIAFGVTIKLSPETAVILNPDEYDNTQI